MTPSSDLSQALKQGMRLLASGVCVITSVSDDGEPVAMTASSVTSVSDNPPSLLVCVNQKAAMNQAMLAHKPFAVNVLHDRQRQISMNCATPGAAATRFAEGQWQQEDTSGLSYLSDALCTFFCHTEQVIAYGTHNIFIGNVTQVALQATDAPILVYANGDYHAL